MQRLILILLLFAGHLSVLRAEPFEQAEVKKAINVVSLLPQDVRAAPAISLREIRRSRREVIPEQNCSSRT